MLCISTGIGYLLQKILYSSYGDVDLTVIQIPGLNAAVGTQHIVVTFMYRSLLEDAAIQIS